MNAWSRFWFRDESPVNLVAARMILALNALWLVLSRPKLPEILTWPGAFWIHSDPFTRFRFLIVFPYHLEIVLYVVLVANLLCVLAGRAVRLASFASALLLYHFAPFEDIFTSTGGPFFRGYTLIVSGLLIIAFAERLRLRDRASQEARWPLVLIQLLFAFTYLMSGISKLRLVGWRWATAWNFEGLILCLLFPDVTPPPWAHWFVGHPLLCWAGALTGMAMDFLFVAAVFSRRAARVIVPVTFIAHVVIALTMGVFFIGAPALLLFVNWTWVLEKLRFTPTEPPRQEQGCPLDDGSSARPRA